MRRCMRLRLGATVGVVVALLSACAGTAPQPLPPSPEAASDVVELALALRGGYRPPRTSFVGDAGTAGVHTDIVSIPATDGTSRTVSLALRRGRVEALEVALDAFTAHCAQRTGVLQATQREEPQLTALVNYNQAHLVRVGNAVYLAGHQRRSRLIGEAFDAEFRDRPAGYACMQGEAVLFAVHLYAHRRHLLFSPVDAAGALVPQYPEVLVFAAENNQRLPAQAFLEAYDALYRRNYVTHWAAEMAGGLRVTDARLGDIDSD
jgi:hypothetical protein